MDKLRLLFISELDITLEIAAQAYVTRYNETAESYNRHAPKLVKPEEFKPRKRVKSFKIDTLTPDEMKQVAQTGIREIRYSIPHSCHILVVTHPNRPENPQTKRIHILDAEME